jgi:hypothetical protein
MDETLWLFFGWRGGLARSVNVVDVKGGRRSHPVVSFGGSRVVHRVKSGRLLVVWYWKILLLLGGLQMLIVTVFAPM